MSRPPSPALGRSLLAAAAALATLIPLAACTGEAPERTGARSTLSADHGRDRPGQGADQGAGQGVGEDQARATAEAAARKAAQQAEKEARKRASSQASGQAGSATQAWRRQVLGADVSWPQCPKGMGIPQRKAEGLPMPLPTARYVVLGLTNGPGFTPNPCLADQLDWVRQRHLLASAYAVVSWPADDRPGGARHDGPFDADTPGGRLRNAGYAQASYNVATLKRLDFRTPSVWVDVEPYPVFPWSPDVDANAEVVRGAVRAYRDAGYRVGIYSTPTLWRTVVGDLRFGVPEWRAAGHTSLAEATRRCGGDWSIQGGTALLGQWTDGTRDHNISCPGAVRDPSPWFHQF